MMNSSGSILVQKMFVQIWMKLEAILEHSLKYGKTDFNVLYTAYSIEKMHMSFSIDMRQV